MSHFRRMWNVGRKNIAYAAKWGTLLFAGTALCVDMGISEILGVSITAFGICQLYHARYVLSLFDEYRDALLPYFHMDAKQVERYMMCTVWCRRSEAHRTHSNRWRRLFHDSRPKRAVVFASRDHWGPACQSHSHDDRRNHSSLFWCHNTAHTGGKRLATEVYVVLVPSVGGHGHSPGPAHVISRALSRQNRRPGRALRGRLLSGRRR